MVQPEKERGPWIHASMAEDIEEEDVHLAHMDADDLADFKSRLPPVG